MFLNRDIRYYGIEHREVKLSRQKITEWRVELCVGSTFNKLGDTYI